MGYDDRRKHYVRVVSSTDVDGRVVPLCIVWDDDTRYEVDRVLGVRHAYSRRTGAKGLRYSIQVDGRQTYLYYEDPRWFVEAKIRPSYLG